MVPLFLLAGLLTVVLPALLLGADAPLTAAVAAASAPPPAATAAAAVAAASAPTHGG